MLTPDFVNNMKASPAATGGVAPGQAMSPEQFQSWVGGSTTAAPKPGYFGAAGQDIQNAGQAVHEAITGTGASAGENPITRGFEAAGAAAGAIPSVAADILPPGVRDVAKFAVNAPGNVANWLGGIIGDTKAAQDFVTQHPDAANTLGQIAKVGTSAGTIAGTALGAEGLVKGAGAAAPKIADITTKGVQAVKEAATPKPGEVAHAIAKQQVKAHDAVDTEMRNMAAKYPTVGKILNESEANRGNEPVKVLSSYPEGKALPKIVKGKLQVDEPVNFLKTQVQRLSDIKNKLVGTGKDVTPVDSFKSEAAQAIDSKSWSLAKKSAMKQEVGKLVDSWKETYPKGIPNNELDSLKTEHTNESSSYNSKSPFNPDAHAIVGQVARKLVQKNAGEAPIDELNHLISSHYDAIKLLNSMRGKTPHGGALSRMVNNTLGEVGGLGAGLVVGHPFLGAMAGRAGAEMVNDIVNSHFISNPLKRTLVSNMKGADPEVVQTALDYLDKSGTQPAPGVEPNVNEGNASNQSENSHSENLPQSSPKVKGGTPDMQGIPKELAPLAKEAQKYSSAEDFVKAQEIAYHGSPTPLKQFHNKTGAFFTNSMEDASGFGGNPDNIYEGYLNFKKPLVVDARGAKWDELNNKYGKSTQEIISNAQKDGYDGIVFKNIVDNVMDTADEAGQNNQTTVSYAYKPKDAFLNESQLTDFYNKVMGITKSKP